MEHHERGSCHLGFDVGTSLSRVNLFIPSKRIPRPFVWMPARGPIQKRTRLGVAHWKAPVKWAHVSSCFELSFLLLALLHRCGRTLLAAPEFSLVAVSTSLPESHQSPIRIKARRQRGFGSGLEVPHLGKKKEDIHAHYDFSLPCK